MRGKEDREKDVGEGKKGGRTKGTVVHHLGHQRKVLLHRPVMPKGTLLIQI